MSTKQQLIQHARTLLRVCRQYRVSSPALIRHSESLSLHLSFSLLRGIMEVLRAAQVCTTSAATSSRGIPTSLINDGKSAACSPSPFLRSVKKPSDSRNRNQRERCCAEAYEGKLRKPYSSLRFHCVDRGSGSGSTFGLFHTTRFVRDRNVVRNTLADTPSGYVQDPRASPSRMTRYDSVSRVGAAALEAMEREKELLEREELAYRGYTTLSIQARKQVALAQHSTQEELQSAVKGLQEDLDALVKMVGQEVEREMSQEHLLLLKWQQRQQRLHDRDLAFRVAPVTPPRYRVVQQADGTEIVERPGKDTPQANLSETDDAYLSQPVEMEVLPDAALVPERTVVTINDVNHVRYVMGLGLRRLSRFDEAEKALYSILADDVTNVDAVESLLEMDLGVEGWEPRIRVLLDFLVVEYKKAITEGRLQPPKEERMEKTDGNGDGEKGNKATNNDAEASHAVSPHPSTSPSAGTDAVKEAASATSISDALPAPAASLVKSAGSNVPYATVPQTAPLAVALSLLSDIIVEAAARKCSTDGEGATSRFFIESLGPIVRALGREYAPALLEALFQAVDEQHFMARFDSDDVSPAARMFALTLVIAFLKALAARRIHEMLPNPVLFEFVTLSKLHAALRRAGRLHESYPICEKMMKLYRANSSLYRARRARMHAAAATGAEVSTSAATAFLSEGLGDRRSQPYAPRALVGVNDGGAGGEQRGSAAAISTSPASESVPSARPGLPAIPGSGDGVPERNATRTAALPAAGTAVAGTSAAVGLSDDAATLPAAAEPPDVLDGQDADYREAFFQYVNDRARDSAALGRRLCLEAMQEFPNSAAPWETLALLLHKENPEKNLRDGIIAARHAMLLEPLNLNVIVTLANFYKAAHRYELHDRMLDRYRLLVYMLEEGASEEDMLATAAEVEALDKETPEAQDLVEETGRELSEYLFRMEQAMTYSMPIDKEPRLFHEAPVRVFSQQLDMRPPEVAAHESDPDEELTVGVTKKFLASRGGGKG